MVPVAALTVLAAGADLLGLLWTGPSLSQDLGSLFKTLDFFWTGWAPLFTDWEGFVGLPIGALFSAASRLKRKQKFILEKQL